MCIVLSSAYYSALWCSLMLTCSLKLMVLSALSLAYYCQERPSPNPTTHFPLFQISPSFQNILQSGNNFPTFHKKFMFHKPTFLMTFFSHWLRFFNSSPYVLKNANFPPISANFYFPLRFKCSPHFVKFACFSLPSGLTVMRLCIIQCTHWTPLHIALLLQCVSLKCVSCRLKEILHDLYVWGM